MIAKASTISAAAAAVLLTLPHYSIASPTKRQAGPFEPTWESTDQHKPSPEWFKDAKFGIYWHWGGFSVPEYGFEWYPRFMYDANNDMGQHHRATYGDPSVQGGFGYQNFTFGSPDLEGNMVQFKPVRSSEGGEWDPEHWIEVIKASGARFAGPVAEHHDGYALWDSKFNE
ncbi:Alpha-L-fucosidase [Cercospora beticola]|uniref:alpha-L-fucosidase n=1 Tax=Cercospora beticola TaxID=122368 RepID=A0A2G5GM28_CERBT|nr:Alpha-L-fucosidase [Cercospora beticola]PIA81330.1 Alpha-L-fucosidase [Cercospora beticola]WPA97552.1 hypothetical protein RHO25_002162 [Cercospora beticola]CAK1358736.1 unnamed protein product [Cercospora beticola]